MNEQNEKQDCNTVNTNDRSQKRWLPVLRAILYVCLAAILCFSCALFEVCLLKGRTMAMMHGSTDENDKIRIYIDQGHNPSPYHNSGAVGNGLYEQDVTFDIGCLLAERLRQDGRFEVCLSRPEESTVLGTDTISSLKARVDGAAAFGADYFISLHTNAYSQDTVKGIEVFSAEKDDESYSFGNALLEGMVDSTDLKNRGMKQGSELYVLKNAEMPAVLLEMGFISNAEDAALQSAHPELFAEGIYNGILDHFESAYTLDFTILLWMIGITSAPVVAFIIIEGIHRKRR